MELGIYAPSPNVTVGSLDAARAVAEALLPLAPGRRDAQFDLSLDVLLAAESSGFGLCLFAERHLGHDIGAWIMAAAVGSRFDRMRSLVAVHPGLWDPVMTAKLAASLDRICGGRMAINVVNGNQDEEFRMFGGTVLKGEPRYKRTEEFIAILRGLWLNRTFSYSGDHYSLQDGQLLLKPASPTPPEIYSVSSSERGRESIADTCDWWFVGTPKDADSPYAVLRSMEKDIADMERRCRDRGRSMRYAITPFLALGPSTESALTSVVKQILEIETGTYVGKVEARMLPATRAGLVGTPKDVLEQLRRFQDLGIELVLCKLLPTVDNVHRIGAEVVSHLKASQPLFSP
jgi:FMNH2-dependent dimethyl sulfone monooxygenase